jgi:LAGLIDADG-like domain
LPPVLSVNVNAPSVGFTDFNHSALMKTLSEVEAAYVAGIIDGEGTVTLTRTHRGENRRPVVSISSTELQLLTYVQSVIGAGRITGKARAREHHSPSFAYCITSRQALALLAQVYPFLRTYKSRRACLLLEEYQRVTPRNGRYTAELLAARAQLEARFFAISTRAGTPRRVAH